MAVAAAAHAASSVIRVKPDGQSLLLSGPYTYLAARTWRRWQSAQRNRWGVCASTHSMCRMFGAGAARQVRELKHIPLPLYVQWLSLENTHVQCSSHSTRLQHSRGMALYLAIQNLYTWI